MLKVNGILTKWYDCISYWDLFCSHFCFLSAYSGLAGNQALAIYLSKISLTRFLVLWRNLLLQYQITLEVAVCAMQPHAQFSWNETKSFDCRLCNWQKKFQLLSGNTKKALNNKGKIYFPVSGQQKLRICVLSTLNVNTESVK